MALNILTFPDPRLRTCAEPVQAVDGTIRTLIDDMLETMYQNNGIGLAATQVNIHSRVLVMDVSEERNTPRSFINPQVTILDDEVIPCEEGCLSVIDVRATISRPARVRVQSLNLQGDSVTCELDGLEAVCIQHEIDHLNGILFIDYLSNLQLQRIRDRSIKKLRRQMA